jgi:hypothetical protein
MTEQEDRTVLLFLGDCVKDGMCLECLLKFPYALKEIHPIIFRNDIVNLNRGRDLFQEYNDDPDSFCIPPFLTDDGDVSAVTFDQMLGSLGNGRAVVLVGDEDIWGRCMKHAVQIGSIFTRVLAVEVVAEGEDEESVFPSGSRLKLTYDERGRVDEDRFLGWMNSHLRLSNVDGLALGLAADPADLRLADAVPTIEELGHYDRVMPQEIPSDEGELKAVRESANEQPQMNNEELSFHRQQGDCEYADEFAPARKGLPIQAKIVCPAGKTGPPVIEPFDDIEKGWKVEDLEDGSSLPLTAPPSPRPVVVKSVWGEKEDMLLLRLVEDTPGDDVFERITDQFPGRTEDDIKRQFEHLLRQKANNALVVEVESKKCFFITF